MGYYIDRCITYTTALFTNILYTYVHIYVCMYVCTVIYQLIAATTITFSKQKGVATKRGWPLNLCRVLSSNVYTVLSYVSDLADYLYQIARTCS